MKNPLFITLFIIQILLLSSCKDEKKNNLEVLSEKNQQTEKNVTIEEQLDVDVLLNKEKENIIKSNITFTEKNETAVLIGDHIKCLDNNFRLVEKIKLKEGEIVHINAVSDSLFKKTSEYCDSYNLVKIYINGSSKIVDGRNVYRLEKPHIDDNTNVKIYRTEFYGISEADEAGLTFCQSYNQPMIIYDPKKNYQGLVEVIKNDVHVEIFNGLNDFEYFELFHNDGFHDTLTKLTATENGYILDIHRDFQEGYTDFQVEILNIDEYYTAKYLNYPETKYDNY